MGPWEKAFYRQQEGGSAEILCCEPEDDAGCAPLAAAHGMPAQSSLEERMGCGYGACFALAPTAGSGDA